jgi:hypothetical protein
MNYLAKMHVFSELLQWFRKSEYQCRVHADVGAGWRLQKGPAPFTAPDDNVLVQVKVIIRNGGAPINSYSIVPIGPCTSITVYEVLVVGQTRVALRELGTAASSPPCLLLCSCTCTGTGTGSGPGTRIDLLV